MHCTCLKCCVNIITCYRFKGTPTGVNVKKRRGGFKPVPTVRRGSVVGGKDDDTRRALLQANLEIKYEPDNGAIWNACHWVFFFVFSAKVASFIIWALSFVFLTYHLNNYKDRCELKTEYRLDTEIKQIWLNETKSPTYDVVCSMDSNPIIGNVSNILIFLLTLALGAGLDKYKETLRLYEEIAGDIKAMAMLLVHLTFDSEKYSIKDGELEFKEDVKITYRKLKYILASLAPTVKNTISMGEYTVLYQPNKCSCPKLACNSKVFPWSTPFEALSDRKYFKVTTQRFPWYLFFSSTVEYPNYWKNADEEYTDIKKYKQLKTVLDQGTFELSGIKLDTDRKRLFALLHNAGLELNTEVQLSLYEKITDIHKNTEMDAFECSMTVLLDELMRLFENKLGFGEDEGSAVASAAIDRWNALYGTWGTLASLKTYSEPLVVNMFRAGLIGVYAWFMPKGYLKYYEIVDNYWLYIFVGGDMFIFCLMWWLAFAVRNPFKNSWIIRNVGKLAYQTQYQVQQLMSNQKAFDSMDYKSNSKYGYIQIPNGKDKTVGIDIFKEDSRSVEEILATSLNSRNQSATTQSLGLKKIIKEALDELVTQTGDRDKRLEEIIKEAMGGIEKEHKIERETLEEAIRTYLAKTPAPLPPPPPPIGGIRKRPLNF